MRILKTIGISALFVLFLGIGFSYGQEELYFELNDKYNTLYDQGRYSEAVKVAEEELKVAENTFGKDDPAVAYANYALGFAYNAQGRYAEAEPLYKQALGILEKVFGKDHPRVATVCENMAEFYKNVGKKDKAAVLEE